jgi:hypothetical protein
MSLHHHMYFNASVEKAMPLSASSYDEHRNLCFVMDDSVGNAAKY